MSGCSATARAAHRRGKVQLIDASQWYRPLRKNLGKKNCELSDEDIARVMATYDAFAETPQSKIFANQAFGYWKSRSKGRCVCTASFRRMPSTACALRPAMKRSAAPCMTSWAMPCLKTSRACAPTSSGDWPSGEVPMGKMSRKRTKMLRKGAAGKEEEALDAKTWERDGRLARTATELRRLLGDGF